MQLKLFNIFFDFSHNLGLVLFLSLLSCFILFLCIKFYRTFFILDRKSKIYLNDIRSCYLKRIGDLDVKADDFTLNLNREVRLFLEELQILMKALSKSKEEVSSSFSETRIKNIFDELEKSEYSRSEMKSDKDKQVLKDKFIYIITKI